MTVLSVHGPARSAHVSSTCRLYVHRTKLGLCYNSAGKLYFTLLLSPGFCITSGTRTASFPSMTARVEEWLYFLINSKQFDLDVADLSTMPARHNCIVIMVSKYPRIILSFRDSAHYPVVQLFRRHRDVFVGVMCNEAFTHVSALIAHRHKSLYHVF
jgi:hypothetical protein